MAAKAFHFKQYAEFAVLIAASALNCVAVLCWLKAIFLMMFSAFVQVQIQSAGESILQVLVIFVILICRAFPIEVLLQVSFFYLSGYYI